MTTTVWILIVLVIAVTTAGPAIIIWVARRSSRHFDKQEKDDGEGSDTL